MFTCIISAKQYSSLLTLIYWRRISRNHFKTSCARGDTICLRPVQVDSIFAVSSVTGQSYGQSYYSTLIGNHTYIIEWYHVWWPWLTSKRVSWACQHQLSFSFVSVCRVVGLTEWDAEEKPARWAVSATAAAAAADDTQGDYGRQWRRRQIGADTSVHVRRGEWLIHL